MCLADGEGRKGTQQEESSEFQAPGTPGFLLVSQTQVLSQFECTRPGEAVFRWTPGSSKVTLVNLPWLLVGPAPLVPPPESDTLSCHSPFQLLLRITALSWVPWTDTLLTPCGLGALGSAHWSQGHCSNHSNVLHPHWPDLIYV